MTALEIIGSVLVLLGSAVFGVAALGLVRFPDVYTRVSAIGTAAGTGIGLLVLGVAFLHLTPMVLVKALLAILLQLITSSIGTIAIARSAYLTGVSMRRWTYDDLDDADGTHPAEGWVPPREEPTGR